MAVTRPRLRLGSPDGAIGERGEGGRGDDGRGGVEGTVVGRAPKLCEGAAAGSVWLPASCARAEEIQWHVGLLLLYYYYYYTILLIYSYY